MNKLSEKSWEDDAMQLPSISIAAILRILTGLIWIFLGLRILNDVLVLPVTVAIGTILIGLGVLVMVLSGLGLRPAKLFWLDLLILLITAVAIAAFALTVTYNSPGYGTDEIALDQMAASLAAHFMNPYGANLGSALNQFGVPPPFVTNLLNGTVVNKLSYPALSFLFYVPVIWAGIQVQAAVIVNVIFWILTFVVLWLCLPRQLRPLAPIVATMSIFTELVLGGVVDPIYLPFLLLALWRWDRFYEKGNGLATWIGPVGLGLAACVKQVAWFVAPFLVLGIILDARQKHQPWGKRVMVYVGIALGSFLVPNLPFIYASPPLWLKSITLPLLQPLVPFGQGIIGFTDYFGWGGGNLKDFTYAAVVAAMIMIAVLVLFYRRSKRIIVALPMVVLFFPTRSLGSYFVFLVPAIIISFATVLPVPENWALLSRRVRQWCLGGVLVLVVVAGGFVVRGFTAPAPLRFQLLSTNSTGDLQSIDEITVRVANVSQRNVIPYFTVGLGPYMSNDWLRSVGPKKLDARSSAIYDLWAPNVESMPGLNQELLIYGLTDNPAALSSQRLVASHTMHLKISPDSISTIVGLRQKVRIKVELENQLNQPVHQAGVTVNLGQVIYSQLGLLPAETSINGSQEGRSPVTAKTNRYGVAYFTMQGDQLQSQETFYQAWLTKPYPYGYSNMLSVRFGK